MDGALDPRVWLSGSESVKLYCDSPLSSSLPPYWQGSERAFGLAAFKVSVAKNYKVRAAC